MLATLGYQPVVAHRSEEALKLFELNPQRFDLVITDQVMPGMTGAELSKALLSVRPDLPIILIAKHFGGTGILDDQLHDRARGGDTLVSACPLRLLLDFFARGIQATFDAHHHRLRNQTAE